MIDHTGHRRFPRLGGWAWVLLIVFGLMGCGTTQEDPASAEISPAVQARLLATLDEAQRQIDAHLAALEDSLRPIPFLTPQQTTALRRHRNDAQLARAERLGARPADSTELALLIREGELVPLEKNSRYWYLRRLTHSIPYVTPDTKELLEAIGQRFHEQLAEKGLPPIRFQITSVLRTAETQASLRRVNVNAATGISTHEYGTTLDLSYTRFSLPKEPLIGVETSEFPWLASHFQKRMDRAAVAILKKRQRELKALLGAALIELQDEGRVMVMLERRQPVFHLTLAKRHDDRRTATPTADPNLATP